MEGLEQCVSSAGGYSLTGLSTTSDGQCFLVIKRPPYLKHTGSLDQLDPASSVPVGYDAGDEINEDGDAECLRKEYPPSGDEAFHDRAIVEYHIILSPVYRVPVLHFHLSSAPSIPDSGIEAVYKHLVPGQYKSSMSSGGIIGNISIGYHPMYNTPSFFIHPCRTADAMRDLAADVQLDDISYFMLWLGLVGPPVGLSLPSRLAEELQM